jgi:hypothetical protein
MCSYTTCGKVLCDEEGLRSRTALKQSPLPTNGVTCAKDVNCSLGCVHVLVIESLMRTFGYCWRFCDIHANT